MKFFSNKELKIVGSILLIIAFISFFNFRISIRRARDNQRKNDLGVLQSSLEKYNRIVGIFPLSTEDGKIMACKDDDTYFDKKLKIWVNVKACNWGNDVLRDFSESESEILMNPIPTDPKNEEGLSFLYISNGTRYQVFAHLEGKDEAEYDPLIEKRGLMCGNQICNYGRTYGSTPLDKSLEEYENELLKK